MNAIIPAPQPSTGLMPSTIDQAMRLADMMATARLVPTHLQGKPGDCLLVIEQAVRWGMSPFAVAQATSVISGKLMFEGKLVAAALNASGILSSRLTYDFEGDGADRAITAKATLRGETAPRVIRCTLAEARTTNGMWTKQPDQQLVYFSTRAWARRHAPEVMLGVYAPEDFDAPPAVEPVFRGVTVDAEPAPSPAFAAPEQPRRTWRTLIEEVRGMLTGCDTVDAVVAVADLPQVRGALEKGPQAVSNEISALLADAYAKTPPQTHPEAEGEDTTDDALADALRD